jgi:hypothetical protein
LSGLTRFNQLEGIFPQVVSSDGANNAGGTFSLGQVSSQRVPEPSATASFLGVGALGVASLLKRKKHLKKTV